MTPILELRNVRKAYGDFVAVKDVSLSVPAGCIFGLLGPNGAGKTSTIRMIMNIVPQDSGEVLVFGHPGKPEDLRRMVEFLEIHEFRSEEPELEQIFMKAVRDAA